MVVADEFEDDSAQSVCGLNTFVYSPHLLGPPSDKVPYSNPRVLVATPCLSSFIGVDQRRDDNRSSKPFFPDRMVERPALNPSIQFPGIIEISSFPSSVYSWTPCSWPDVRSAGRSSLRMRTESSSSVKRVCDDIGFLLSVNNDREFAFVAFVLLRWWLGVRN